MKRHLASRLIAPLAVAIGIAGCGGSSAPQHPSTAQVCTEMRADAVTYGREMGKGQLPMPGRTQSLGTAYLAVDVAAWNEGKFSGPNRASGDTAPPEWKGARQISCAF